VGPLVANLPPGNPTFTGHADLLDQLHQRLHPGQPAAVVQVQAQTLHGLGGLVLLAREHAALGQREPFPVVGVDELGGEGVASDPVVARASGDPLDRSSIERE
jgi:hypothetical protein